MGSSTTLASGVTQALSSGDKVAVRVVGSVVTALHFSGGVWQQVLSYDTSADSVKYVNAGNVAIEFKTSTLDDFGGGTISTGGGSPPVNTGLPVVSGSAVVGQVLSASSGTWSGVPAPTFGYAWQRCDSGGANCAPIGGATSQTYTLVAGDAGSTIRVVVTATNTSGSASASSAQTGVVVAASSPPVNTSLPVVSGSAVQGQSLSASAGVWSGVPAPTFGYQWQRCNSGGSSCVDVVGATGSSLLLGASDVGSTFVVVVTATNGSGSAVASSLASAVVVASSGIGPTTPVLDNFNRANGGVGSNWSLIRPTGFGGMNVSGNAAVDASASSFAWDYWNAGSFGPDSEAYVTVATYAAADTIRIGARVSNAGTTGQSGYYASVSSAGAWSILRITGGVVDDACFGGDAGVVVG